MPQDKKAHFDRAAVLRAKAKKAALHSIYKRDYARDLEAHDTPLFMKYSNTRNVRRADKEADRSLRDAMAFNKAARAAAKAQTDTRKKNRKGQVSI